jgi:hypothetical protein
MDRVPVSRLDLDIFSKIFNPKINYIIKNLSKFSNSDNLALLLTFKKILSLEKSSFKDHPI